MFGRQMFLLFLSQNNFIVLYRISTFQILILSVVRCHNKCFYIGKYLLKLVHIDVYYTKQNGTSALVLSAVQLQ